MKIESIEPIIREEAQRAFDSANVELIAFALIRITYHDPDWKWVQNKCLHYVSHPDVNLQRLAIVCLGHLARIHGNLDRDQVLPVLAQLLNDPESSGYVEDALDDIKMYIGEPQ